MSNYDFSGWATKFNRRCSDGRTIMKSAFKNNDGETVPLVWNHQHDNPNNVLGHARLEHRSEGVYAYGKFNDTKDAAIAKVLINHDDISALSIFANELVESGSNVLHGNIREVSLVLAGANPDAVIENVLSHSDEGGTAMAYIYPGDDDCELQHSEDGIAENKEKTLEEIFNTLTEEQKNAMYELIDQIIEGLSEEKASEKDVDETKKPVDEKATPEEPETSEEKEADDSEDEEKDKNGGNKTMKHNVFDKSETKKKNALSHADADMIIKDARRYGSMKESALAHGIENIDYLFPDAKSVTDAPVYIKKKDGWVQEVIGGVHRTPFARIKSIFANLTEDEARAKGYTKGKLKKEELFSLLKRTTSPTTVYKKQKIDRDDMVDITDFDTVNWIKSEMRMMLDEELATAMLVGDGRLPSSDDKINEQNIRPIWTDDKLYVVNALVEVKSDTTNEAKAKSFIRETVKAQKDYLGSGNKTLFISEDWLTECLLLTDSTGRDLYSDEAQLAKKLRVNKIVSVPVMEGKTRTVETKKRDLIGIIVDLDDYNVGADKGGAVNMFDDFDIDYNAQKYLIETRCSGALVKPYSAIVVETVATA